jgi:hypothetical protein
MSDELIIIIIIYEKKVLRKIRGRKRDGQYRVVRNEKLRRLHRSPGILIIVKSRVIERGKQGIFSELYCNIILENACLEYQEINGIRY